MGGKSNLPDDYLAALGQVALNAAALEYGLDWVIWTLVGPDHAVGAAVSEGLQSARKVEQIRRLMNVRSPDDDLRARVADLLADIRKAQTTRNQLVHRAWLDSPDAPPGEFTQFTYQVGQKGATIKPERVTLDDLLGAAATLWDCFQRVEGILGELTVLSGY